MTDAHTREKPFPCNIDGCQEKFRQRGKRSIHQREAHGKGLVGAKRFHDDDDSDDGITYKNNLNPKNDRHFNSPSLN